MSTGGISISRRSTRSPRACGSRRRRRSSCRCRPAGSKRRSRGTTATDASTSPASPRRQPTIARSAPGSLLAATTAWGLNEESGDASQAFLIEGSLTLDERHSWFGRAEAAGKAAHDLDVHDSDETFTVGKLQAGYTRYFASWRGLTPGVGGSISAGLVPRSLIPLYGGRATMGFGLFVTLRPSSSGM